MLPDGGALNANGRRVVDLAVHYRLPTLHPFTENVEAGGLIGCAQDDANRGRLAAGDVDQILERASLPVQQATLFELVVNQTTQPRRSASRSRQRSRDK